MTAEAEIAQCKKELARERAESAKLGQKLEEVLRRPGKVERCIFMRWQRLAHAGAVNTLQPALESYLLQKRP